MRPATTINCRNNKEGHAHWHSCRLQLFQQSPRHTRCAGRVLRQWVLVCICVCGTLARSPSVDLPALPPTTIWEVLALGASWADASPSWPLFLSLYSSAMVRIWGCWKKPSALTKKKTNAQGSHPCSFECYCIFTRHSLRTWRFLSFHLRDLSAYHPE